MEGLEARAWDISLFKGHGAWKPLPERLTSSQKESMRDG